MGVGAPVKWGILSTADINRKVIPGAHASREGRAHGRGVRDLRRAREYAREWMIERTYGSYGNRLRTRPRLTARCVARREQR